MNHKTQIQQMAPKRQFLNTPNSMSRRGQIVVHGGHVTKHSSESTEKK